MPVVLQCDDFCLSEGEIARLWEETCVYREHADDEVTVRCVDKEEIRKLNKKYRDRDDPTNVLTFSYPTSPRLREAQHDVALCIQIADEEAQARKAVLRDYVALLLTHAFLHATGMDHDLSSDMARAADLAERTILRRSGFEVDSLWVC